MRVPKLGDPEVGQAELGVSVSEACNYCGSGQEDLETENGEPEDKALRVHSAEFPGVPSLDLLRRSDRKFLLIEECILLRR